MTTNPEEPLKAEDLRDEAERIARTVIAGHPQGSVRRIILYVVLVACIAIEYGLGGAPAAIGAVAGGLVATVLLLATDMLL